MLFRNRRNFTGQVTDDGSDFTAGHSDGWHAGQVIEGGSLSLLPQTGKWELVLRNGQLTAGQSVQIELTAADEAGMRPT